MGQEIRQIRPDMLARIQQRNQEFGKKVVEARTAEVEGYKSRTPEFLETNEIGTFAGIFSKRIGGDQVVVRPYYQTPGGLYFCEVRGPQGEGVFGPQGDPEMTQIDIASLQSSDTVRFYTPEGYVSGKPLPRQGKPQK